MAQEIKKSMSELFALFLCSSVIDLGIIMILCNPTGAKQTSEESPILTQLAKIILSYAFSILKPSSEH